MSRDGRGRGDRGRPAAPSDSSLEATLDDLYRQHLTTVYGFCRARLSEPDAEDVTAEVFRIAAEKIREDPTAVLQRSWFLTVARRRVIDHWRRTARWTIRLEYAATTKALDPATGPVDGEHGRAVQALDHLPCAQRAAIVLHHVEGLPVKEVATILGRSPRAVESLLARGRKALEALLRRPAGFPSDSGPAALEGW